MKRSLDRLAVWALWRIETVSDWLSRSGEAVCEWCYHARGQIAVQRWRRERPEDLAMLEAEDSRPGAVERAIRKREWLEAKDV